VLLITVIGFVVGVAALLLAVVALRRTAHTISWEPTGGPDWFELWNNGPQDVVIVHAAVLDGSTANGPMAGPDCMLAGVDERLFGDELQDKGHVPPPRRRLGVQLHVNTDLQIRYRVKELLGFVSRATVTIEGWL